MTGFSENILAVVMSQITKHTVMLWNILKIVFAIKINYHSNSITCIEGINVIAFAMYPLGCQLSVYREDSLVELVGYKQTNQHIY